MKKAAIIGQFLEFLIQNRKWWLMPISIALLVLGILIILAKGSALAPFIYTLF